MHSNTIIVLITLAVGMGAVAEPWAFHTGFRPGQGEPMLEGLPEGTTVKIAEDASAEDGKMLKIAYTGQGAQSVPLFRVMPDNSAQLSALGVEASILDYEARVRCEDVVGTAYIEMWCTMAEGQSYFSRALNDPLSGTQPWRVTRTPFRLETGQRPSSIALGLRFEGPGTVYLDHAGLQRRSQGSFGSTNNPGAILGVAGGLFGALVGVWGGVMGWLVSRGRARGLVVASMAALLGIGILLVLLAVILWASGAAYAYWYSAGLMGILLSLVMGANLPGILRRYQAMENQRINALDQSGSL